MAPFFIRWWNGKPYAMGSASLCKLNGLYLQKFTFYSPPIFVQDASGGRIPYLLVAFLVWNLSRWCLIREIWGGRFAIVHRSSARWCGRCPTLANTARSELSGLCRGQRGYVGKFEVVKRYSAIQSNQGFFVDLTPTTDQTGCEIWALLIWKLSVWRPKVRDKKHLPRISARFALRSTCELWYHSCFCVPGQRFISSKKSGSFQSLQGLLTKGSLVSRVYVLLSPIKTLSSKISITFLVWLLQWCTITLPLVYLYCHRWDRGMVAIALESIVWRLNQCDLLCSSASLSHQVLNKLHRG